MLPMQKIWLFYKYLYIYIYRLSVADGLQLKKLYLSILHFIEGVLRKRGANAFIRPSLAVAAAISVLRVGRIISNSNMSQGPLPSLPVHEVQPPPSRYKRILPFSRYPSLPSLSHPSHHHWRPRLLFEVSLILVHVGHGVLLKTPTPDDVNGRCPE